MIKSGARGLNILMCLTIIATTSYCQEFQSMRAHLERSYYESLFLRKEVIPTTQKYGYQSKQMDSLNARIISFDSVGLMFAKNIIRKYGWLGKSQIGELANQTLFLLIQHSPDERTMEECFPLLEKSAQQGESSLADMGCMKDRILVFKGLKQVYGTQKDVNNRYYPIEDSVNVIGK